MQPWWSKGKILVHLKGGELCVMKTIELMRALEPLVFDTEKKRVRRHVYSLGGMENAHKEADALRKVKRLQRSLVSGTMHTKVRRSKSPKNTRTVSLSQLQAHPELIYKLTV
jgi:hypothetical protein